MEVLRKLGVILAVAVLFSIFVFALADALVPEEDYPEYCQQSVYDQPYVEKPRTSETCDDIVEPTQEEIDACPGNMVPNYRTGGCPTEYVCDCWDLQQQYNERADNIRFWVAIIIGFIAIVAGIMLPGSNPLNAWIGSGFMLGGLITIFIATASYWRHIDKIARPIVIALELALVIYLAYRQFGPKKRGKKK